MTITTEDAIKAAASVARDLADGRIAPTDLEHHAVSELRQLAGEVVGPGDPVWPLQVQIAHGVLAAGGIDADELSEWLAVARHRAGVPLSRPEPNQGAPEPVAVPSVALSPESADPGVDSEQAVVVEVDQPVVADFPPEPPRRAGHYDPLATWRPGDSRRS